MNKMELVVTMGGLGTRFREAGYDIPKYMIEAKGKTLFEWAVSSLSGFANDAEEYIFIAMNDSREDVCRFIESSCKKMQIKEYRIILIDYLTDGQATTAMLASEYWKKENSLLIYNIDTYVEEGQMRSEEMHGDGFIPCFKAGGNHWSFVKIDADGKAVEIREKQRISDYCTLGAYYFKTCGLYEKLYQGYYGRGNHLINGEKYVAPLYNYLLEKGGLIYISDIMPEKVHVLGTPEELDLFLAKEVLA